MIAPGHPPVARSTGIHQHAKGHWLACGILLFLAFLFMFVGVHVVRAQAPDPTDQVHAIAKQLNCPTCSGRNLADCQTDTCTQWKQEIKSQLDAGKSPQQVIDFFKARFGPTVLQEPPKEGVVLVLWVLPVVGLVVLAVGAVIFLRRVSERKAITVQPVTPGVDGEPVDEYVARLEEEVRKL